jgi:hypothetical protein
MTSPDNQNFYASFFNNDDQLPLVNLSNELKIDAIKNEIEDFKSFISKPQNLQSIKSTTFFWNSEAQKTKYPCLRQLALILFNINSSSAWIESFFSICGYMEDIRSGNISTDLFTAKCVFRSNIQRLENLTKVRNN